MQWNLKKNAFDYCSYLLVLTLPFSTAIPNLILVVVSLLFLKALIVDKSVKINWRPIALLLVLFAYLFAKALIFNTYAADYKIYNGYLLLVWLLLVFQNIKNTQRFKLVIMLMATLTTLCSFVLIINYYRQTHLLPFGNDSETNTLLFLQRPYAGITAVVGFFISISFIKVFEKYKWWFAANAVLMALFIIIVSARLSLLTIFFMGIVFVLFYYNISLYKKIGFIVVLFGFAASLLFFNDNISKRFFVAENFRKSVDDASDLEPRVVIWSCAKDISSQPDYNHFFGLESYTDIASKYRSCYASKIDKPSKREYFLFERFNSHNQFIDFYLIGGLVAVLLFIAFLLNFFYGIKNSYTATALLMSFVFFFILENVFYRQYGCFLFALFATLYCREKMEEAR